MSQEKENNFKVGPDGLNNYERHVFGFMEKVDAQKRQMETMIKDATEILEE